MEMPELRRRTAPRRRTLLLGSLGVLLLALATARCQPAPEGWLPILEQTSVVSLRTETQEAADHVSRARSLMASTPAAAEAELDGAEEALRHLLVYYLPMVDARERSYNAYRHFYLGEKDLAASELDGIEKILVEIASAGPHFARELERPLAAVAVARSALAGSSGDAPSHLAALATEINAYVIKGRLVLQSADQ